MKMVNKFGLSKTRVLLCICFLIASAALFGFLRNQNSDKDLNAPVFQVPGEELVYQEGSDPVELTVGVKAVDDVDGDVSDTVRVRSIYYPEGSDEATVTYVAKDHSNNLGIIRRTVRVERNQEEETEAIEETEAASENNPAAENPKGN